MKTRKIKPASQLRLYAGEHFQHTRGAHTRIIIKLRKT